MAANDDLADNADGHSEENTEDDVFIGFFVKDGAEEAERQWEHAVQEIVNARTEQQDSWLIEQRMDLAVARYKNLLTFILDDRVKQITDDVIRDMIQEKVDKSLFGSQPD